MHLLMKPHRAGAHLKDLRPFGTAEFRDPLKALAYLVRTERTVGDRSPVRNVQASFHLSDKKHALPGAGREGVATGVILVG
jgi:hypothetical protein